MWHFLFTGRIQVNNFATATFHGITSTNLKNISYTHQQNSQRQDHLHIRGEYEPEASSGSLFLGSSPHTWRIPSQTNTKTITLRIISTYVENTITLSQPTLQSQDHLHIRGEYNKKMEL